MCGRFTLSVPPEVLAKLFALGAMPSYEPRYNIAPTQDVLILRPGKELVSARWGLVFGDAEKDSGGKMINARQETVFERPGFKGCAVKRRCLVPADAFFEWRKAGKLKQPYMIGLSDGAPLAMAGIWSRWHRPDGEPLDTCAVLTTRPNELVAELHDRMPVIIEPQDFELWLDPQVQARAPLEHLLAPLPAARMRMVAVSSRVNDVKNDDAGCIAPAEPARQMGFEFPGKRSGPGAA